MVAGPDTNGREAGVAAPDLFRGLGCHSFAGSREDLLAGEAGEAIRRRELERDWLGNRPSCRPPVRSFPGGIARLRPLITLCISIATKETQHASDRSTCRFSGTHLVDWPCRGLWPMRPGRLPPAGNLLRCRARLCHADLHHSVRSAECDLLQDGRYLPTGDDDETRDVSR